MQLKYGFKKEWLHFLRSFRFGGMMICIFSFAAANPLLYKALFALMEMMEKSDMGAIMAEEGASLGAIATMVDNAAAIFSMVLIELCGSSMLVIMLLLMSPFGGEQKKRATFIPFCSGLSFRNYLIPKFVLYPAVLFIGIFVGGCFGGLLCNSLFAVGTVDFVTILLGSLLAAIYSVFILSIYMALGICTGRPGIMVIVVYIGQTLIQFILTSLDLARFNPFALYGMFSGGAIFDPQYIERETPDVIISVLLAIIISTLMYFVALAALRSKKINNQENKPEF